MQTIVQPSRTIDDAAGRRDGWAFSALLSGFIATFCLSVVVTGAYAFSSGLGVSDGNWFERWLYGLANNPTANRTTDAFFLALALNLAVGLALAVVYAAVVERRLSGSGWRKGMIFSLAPFLVSVVVVYPLMGIGILGVDAGAGPLPVLGSLVAHLVYGFVLGGFYGSSVDDWADSSDQDRQKAHLANRGSARGLAIGLPIGTALGLLMVPILDNLAGGVAVVLAYTLLGGAFGLLIGSFMGMGDDSTPDPAADRE